MSTSSTPESRAEISRRHLALARERRRQQLEEKKAAAAAEVVSVTQPPPPTPPSVYTAPSGSGVGDLEPSVLVNNPFVTYRPPLTENTPVSLHPILKPDYSSIPKSTPKKSTVRFEESEDTSMEEETDMEEDPQEPEEKISLKRKRDEKSPNNPSSKRNKPNHNDYDVDPYTSRMHPRGQIPHMDFGRFLVKSGGAIAVFLASLGFRYFLSWGVDKAVSNLSKPTVIPPPSTSEPEKKMIEPEYSLH